jgi:polysaccharide deacetylase 2 family uncharacterized protein YibQ
MVRSRKKRIKGRKKKGRKFFLFIILGLILSLGVFFFLWTKPVQKEVVKKMPLPPEPVAKEPAEAKKEKEEAPPLLPRLALIIDDGGYDMERFKGMMGIGRSMTFAILPNTPHARQAALMAHEDGSEIMLHLPMEPKESDRYSLEPDTLLTGMSKKEIQTILQRDISQIPHVRGVNNHMGSKATEDPEVMKALMGVLKKEGLYYVDSHTSSQTVGPQFARQAGVAFGSNDRFIDHEKDLEAIKKAIRLAMKRAKKEGKAIAIGHPHPLTAQGIREMIPEIEAAGIRLVFASEIVG